MRFWEIDAVRGVAIVLMLIFNYSFTLAFFSLLKADNWTYWWLFPRFIAALFIIIAGISVTISIAKGKSQLKRGAELFAIGLCITAVTWFLFPKWTILFGILHFLGIAVMLAPLFKNEKTNLLLGVVFILLGILFSMVLINAQFLLWLIPQNFTTFDYFPLLPWFGFFLIGMFFGQKFYKNGKRTFKLRDAPIVAKPLSFLGRHSLLIYIIHQPILVSILFISGIVVF